MTNQKYFRISAWVMIALCCAILTGWGLSPAPVFAQGTPIVTYIPANKTVILGSDAGFNPASQPITIPALAATLATQGHSDVIVDQGNNVWLVKASILVRTTGRLELTSASVGRIRLESTATNFVILTVQRGGQIVVDGVTLTSWDTTTNAPDENLMDGRSYLQAIDGGRLDIINKSDVGYLGYGANATGGLTWRKRANAADPTTGATGQVVDSKIHHNFVGLYASEAYSMVISSNQVYTNANSGMLFQDVAQEFTISQNTVYQNGQHGIVIARSSVNNRILNNKVHDNALHGILLERASNNNVLSGNEVYSNSDGIAITQSSNNRIENNYAHNNVQGLRISATAATLSTENLVINNRVINNSVHGIYLYSNADRNTLRANTVEGNGENGIYLKSGGNLLESNIVRKGVTGIAILGGEAAVAAEADEANLPTIPALDPPGTANVIISSTITANSEVGLRISGGSSNRIGGDPAAPQAGGGNLIEANGREGIAIIPSTSGAASVGNVIYGNIIRGNARSGISLRDPTTVGNRISHNQIKDNGGTAIKIDEGAQGNLAAPIITRVLADGQVEGTAAPNVTVELYTDTGDEAGLFLASVVANAEGRWSVPPMGQNPKQFTALAIANNGNTSIVSERSGATAAPFYTVTLDGNNQPVIEVTDGPAVMTLQTIQSGLGTLNNENLLVKLPNNVWRLNINLLVSSGISLTLSPAAGVQELQLRSRSSVTPTGQVDLSSFVYLRTQDGLLDLDGVKIYSWDDVANAVDEDIVNGRAYVIAKNAATLNIRNSELSYLGSAGSESLGVVWRDINDPATPGELRTRVTGVVENSKFHHNYFGVALLQAQNVKFTGNEFFGNLRGGVLIRDFSNGLLLDGNKAHANGSHGIQLSAGVNAVTIRNNQAYNNSDPTESQAHGLVLDAGTQDAANPDLASTNNIVQGNRLYNNEGLGLRMVNASANQLVSNLLYGNGAGGASLERGSTENVFLSNRLTSNNSHGLVVRGTANANVMTSNVITGNVGNGLYLRSSDNLVNGNLIQGNQTSGIAFSRDQDATATLENNRLVTNTVTNNAKSGIDIGGAAGTLVEKNEVARNTEHGIALSDGANTTMLRGNQVHHNTKYGIYMNGADVFGNTWSANQIYANEGGGIGFGSTVSGNITTPQIVSAEGCTVTGTSREGWTVEIYSDEGDQGHFYQGKTVAGAGGAFLFKASSAWQGVSLTAVATSPDGNSTLFSEPFAAPTGVSCSVLYMPLIRDVS
jgi:parallel beta-helix repeat protein